MPPTKSIINVIRYRIIIIELNIVSQLKGALALLDAIIAVVMFVIGIVPIIVGLLFC